MNGVVAPSSCGTLTAGYPTTHIATHPLPEHTSTIPPQFAAGLYTFSSAKAVMRTGPFVCM